MSKQAQDNIKTVPFEYEFIDFEGETVTGIVNLRKPTPPEISRCTKAMTKDPNRAFKNLVMDLVAEGDREAFKAVALEYPGIPTALGGELFKRAGFESVGN